MKLKIKHNAFSLTEVLIAAGILSIGIMLVATMFPAALYLTATASEKTMAAIVADEAFAKIQIYGIVDPTRSTTRFVRYWQDMSDKIYKDEYVYPSFSGNAQYSWVPLCKKLNSDPLDKRYLVKVFVTRKTNPNQRFYTDATYSDANDWPVPVANDSFTFTSPKYLTLTRSVEKDLINPPPSTIIIDNVSGRTFRIVRRDDMVVTLDRDWDKDINEPENILYMPAGIGPDGKPSGKNPDIEIFQRIIDFGK
jgi:prepilin-type N-terminal cleavage/methylation domain-containing protein